jgi:hypothetical protein
MLIRHSLEARPKRTDTMKTTDTMKYRLLYTLMRHTKAHKIVNKNIRFFTTKHNLM